MPGEARIKAMRWIGRVSSFAVVASVVATLGIVVSPANKFLLLSFGMLSLLLSTAALIAQTRLLLRHVDGLLGAIDGIIAMREAELFAARATELERLEREMRKPHEHI